MRNWPNWLRHLVANEKIARSSRVFRFRIKYAGLMEMVDMRD